MTERLAQIRQRCEAATPGPWVEEDGFILTAAGQRMVADFVPFSANSEFMAAARDDVPYLLAEIERLTAERDALQADAALGALVRRMPEMLGHMYDDETDGECRTFLPDWVSLVLDKRPEEWLVQLGAEDSCLWWVADLGSPERVLAHALTVAATKEASDEQ